MIFDSRQLLFPGYHTTDKLDVWNGEVAVYPEYVS